MHQRFGGRHDSISCSSVSSGCDNYYLINTLVPCNTTQSATRPSINENGPLGPMIYPLRLPRLSHICSRMPSSGILPRRRRPVGPLESQVPVGTLLPPQHVPAQEETRQGGVSLVVAGLGRGRPPSGWLCAGAAVCAEQQLVSHATAICPFPMEHSRHSHSIQGEGHQIVASNQDDEPPQSHKLQGRARRGRPALRVEGRSVYSTDTAGLAAACVCSIRRWERWDP